MNPSFRHLVVAFNQTRYRRKIFESYPDQLMVIKLESTVTCRLDFSIHTNSLLQYAVWVEKNQLFLKGRAPVFKDPDFRRVNKTLVYQEDKGTRFASMVQVHSTNGQVTFTDSSGCARRPGQRLALFKSRGVKDC